MKKIWFKIQFEQVSIIMKNTLFMQKVYFQIEFLNHGYASTGIIILLMI